MVRIFDLGKLVGESRRSKQKCAEVYVDGRGRRRFKGSKFLKRSGLLGY